MGAFTSTFIGDTRTLVPHTRTWFDALPRDIIELILRRYLTHYVDGVVLVTVIGYRVREQILVTLHENCCERLRRGTPAWHKWLKRECMNASAMFASESFAQILRHRQEIAKYRRGPWREHNLNRIAYAIESDTTELMTLRELVHWRHSIRHRELPPRHICAYLTMFHNKIAPELATTYSTASVNAEGITMCMVAASCAKGAFVSMLQDCRAYNPYELRRRDARGKTCLHHACEGVGPDARVRGGCIEQLLRLYVAFAPDAVQWKDTDGNSAFGYLIVRNGITASVFGLHWEFLENGSKWSDPVTTRWRGTVFTSTIGLRAAGIAAPLLLDVDGRSLHPSIDLQDRDYNGGTLQYYAHVDTQVAGAGVDIQKVWSLLKRAGVPMHLRQSHLMWPTVRELPGLWLPPREDTYNVGTVAVS